MAHEHHGHDGHTHHHAHGGHSHENHGHLHTGDGPEPAVCSFTRVLNQKLSGGELAGRLHGVVDALCRWAEEQDLLVGHIKLFVSAAGQSLWLSSTGGPTDEQHTGGWPTADTAGGELHFTAIVYGVTEKTLLEQVDKAFTLLAA